MRFILVLTCFLFSISIYAGTSKIEFFNNQLNNKNVPFDKITQLVEKQFAVDQYRKIKVQVIYNQTGEPNHLLVFLLKKNYHGFKLVRVNIDSQYRILSVIDHYHVTPEDRAQQPGRQVQQAVCPDNSIQFIAFAPNDLEVEQNITIEVANASEAHQLQTISLLKNKATRDSYLNYMTCPNLIGNFYDGDADPYMILTTDGFIYADDIQTILANKFRFKVTNIWLACEAYHDPMRSAVIDIAQTQKYAAGINNLLVGPSDKAAACAMKAAMDNQPMQEAFDDCYKRLDDPADKWGYGGKGSNYFGV